MEDPMVLKRGSIYQTSREVRRMIKLNEDRRMESTYSDETFMSFENVGTSTRIRREDAFLLSEQTESPLSSSDVNLKSPSSDSTHSMPAKSTDFLDMSFCDLHEDLLNLNQSCSSGVSKVSVPVDSSLEICLRCEDIDLPCYKESPSLVDKGYNEEPKSNCNKMLRPDSDENTLYGRDITHALPKSSKIGLLKSPCESEREILKVNRKTWFSPLKNMFDHTMNSKSRQNLSLMKSEKATHITMYPTNVSRNSFVCKSLLNDFSKLAQKMEFDRLVIMKDQASPTASSPAHLHAVLKFETRHDGLSFEFSVKDTEHVLSAKAWSRDGSTFSWAYTFHRSKKKGATIDRHVQSLPIVGQMQVSCLMLSDVGENGSLNNYMETKFILYDVPQARRATFFEESGFECLVTNSSLATTNITETGKCRHHSRHSSVDCDSESSTSYPWSPADLHPHLEIAAIVIQVPCNEENSNDVQREDTKTNEHPYLSSVPLFHEGRAANSRFRGPGVVNVVTASGKHGLPSNKEGVPSSILNRWKFGGGCDCGGWDMTCPITVFDNPCGNLVDYSVTENQESMLLFFQGRKEKVPALSIRANGKGQYSVDFHAQLSALQAFSICIAVLHNPEASRAVGQEKNHHRLRTTSLKLLLEDEVNHLIKAVAEERGEDEKKAEQISSSFILGHPPFSPMGRV